MAPTAITTLKRRQSPLSNASEQLRILDATSQRKTFAHLLREKGMDNLQADGIGILQVNLGKLCNMTCRHCHVDAGPDRREIMSRETIDMCLDALRNSHIKTLDLTGGAPEMNPDFRYVVNAARSLGVHVIDRCNLTILLANGYRDLPQFLAEQQVEIVASLPCYLEQNTDRQRGDGAYRESISALRQLNALGYGQAGSPLSLTLVYNPVGPSLPPSQQQLENDYRNVLRSEHGIEFTRLFTITNMPISRFLEDLIEQQAYETYMQRLIDAFNPTAAAGVMCRTMISVGWDGLLYDCDFNQMLDMPLGGKRRHISQLNPRELEEQAIAVAGHCYGCTAGQGSSCGGALDA